MTKPSLTLIPSQTSGFTLGLSIDADAEPEAPAQDALAHDIPALEETGGSMEE